jgi:acyl carrier protein
MAEPTRASGAAVAPPPAPADDETTLNVVLSVIRQYAAEAGLRLGGPDDPIDAGTMIADMGADSVTLLQIHGALEERLGVEIPMSALFDHPIIGELAAYLAELA